MDDLVSRQKVLQCIKESRENIDWGQSEDGDAFLHYSAALYRTIASKECLPSAERKKGEWIIEDTLNMKVSCSTCGFILEDWIQGALYRYCPNCGAWMGGEEE